MKRLNGTSILMMLALIIYSCNNASGPATGATMPSGESGHEHLPIAAADSAKFVTKTIEVKGDVRNELHLTVDSLRKMKIITLDEFNVVCQSGATTKTDKTSKGVLLKDIIEKAVLKQENHKDRNFIIVARASDDYKATFSWGELFNNPTGENTYVLYEENGKPITEKGEMLLICTNDIKTGPRHVNWLKSIEISKVD